MDILAVRPALFLIKANNKYVKRKTDEAKILRRSLEAPNEVRARIKADKPCLQTERLGSIHLICLLPFRVF